MNLDKQTKDLYRLELAILQSNALFADSNLILGKITKTQYMRTIKKIDKKLLELEKSL